MSWARGLSLGPVAVMPERPNEAEIRRLAAAILAERTEDWTVQRARSMRLPS